MNAQDVCTGCMHRTGCGKMVDLTAAAAGDEEHALNWSNVVEPCKRTGS